jgi:hypothetical protein
MNCTEIAVLWGINPRSFIHVYKCVMDTRCVRLYSDCHTQIEDSKVPMKRCFFSTKLHDVITKNAVTLIIVTVRTANKKATYLLRQF